MDLRSIWKNWWRSYRFVMWKPRYFCDSRISWIIGSRKFLIVFRLLLRNMAIRLRISLSIRSRSTKCVLSLKRLSVMGINSISVWKQVRSQSCMRYFRSISMMRPWSFVMDIKMKVISNWLCWLKKWGNGFFWWWRNWWSWKPSLVWLRKWMWNRISESGSSWLVQGVVNGKNLVAMLVNSD